jgi:hypothetical protein
MIIRRLEEISTDPVDTVEGMMEANENLNEMQPVNKLLDETSLINNRNRMLQ